MGDLIAIIVAALVIWALCGVVATLIIAADENEPELWEGLTVLGMNLVLGPFAFPLVWFLSRSVKADRKQTERRRANQQQSSARTQATTLQTPPPKTWREERPLFWRDR